MLVHVRLATQLTLPSLPLYFHSSPSLPSPPPVPPPTQVSNDPRCRPGKQCILHFECVLCILYARSSAYVRAYVCVHNSSKNWLKHSTPLQLFQVINFRAEESKIRQRPSATTPSLKYATGW